MFLTSQRESVEPSNLCHIDLEQTPKSYKGWLISSKVLNGKLWLRWQHPQESIPRYGCPVGEGGLAETIHHVRFMIDLMITLESEAPKSKKVEPSHEATASLD